MKPLSGPTESLELWDADAKGPFRFEASRLWLAGYTGRDQATVKRHIEELARQGVPVPPSVPVLYPANPQSLQIEGTVWAYDGNSSGEVEYVLLVGEDEVFVTVGSDHTDRALETVSVERSKQIYPKIIGKEIWLLKRLAAEWDSLCLRSHVAETDRLVAYQSGTLKELIRPEALIELLGPRAQAGAVIFSGTLPLIDGRMRFSNRFVGELASPQGPVLARCSYDIIPLGEAG